MCRSGSGGRMWGRKRSSEYTNSSLWCPENLGRHNCRDCTCVNTAQHCTSVLISPFSRPSPDVLTVLSPKPSEGAENCYSLMWRTLHFTLPLG